MAINEFKRETTEHGVFMDIMGVGVLITGESGAGKSELALVLISRGHRFIADDAPEFVRTSPTEIKGRRPGVTAEFIAVHGLGIMNVKALFGADAVAREGRLDLIVDLRPASDDGADGTDQLQPKRGVRRLLGIEIPVVGLGVRPGRNLQVLVECIVRDFLLRRDGYDAAADLESRLATVRRRRR